MLIKNLVGVNLGEWTHTSSIRYTELLGNIVLVWSSGHGPCCVSRLCGGWVGLGLVVVYGPCCVPRLRGVWVGLGLF